MKPQAGLLILLFSASISFAETVNFNRDIRPLLSRQCFECHGPDAHERKSKLRLDQADGEDGAYRIHQGIAAIKPGSVSESEVWRRITSKDPNEVMPPPESKKPDLSEPEQQLIKRWIEEGAPYQGFWAFETPRLPPLPEVENEAWSQHPIDRFVMRQLNTNDLSPSPPADPRTLIRRVTFDLTGLPPTREGIREFLADTSNGAYERLVNRLLTRHQYGEHMTKYWLDLVRFADTNGIHHDHFRDLSPYRDWVVRSFNDNLPYDDFVRFQLAGDLYPNATRDQLIASGFHRLHLIIDVGTALPEESFTRNVIDRVTSVGTAFLGLTVQCAVCHDHKYDPLTMKDFYQLYAFFNNIDAKPETGRRGGSNFLRGLQEPFINLTNAEQEARLREFNKQIAAAQKEVARHKEDQDALKNAEKALKKARDAKTQFELTIPAAMIMKEREEVQPTHILVRGAYDKPGDPVQRDTPSFLPPMKKRRDGPATRADLAEWFVSAEHPLTARVAVNRFWQQLFGVGLVKTAEDLGSQGEWPSHPDLLDYLAVTFVQSGWNVKALMKHIVLSETYKQSSNAPPDAFTRDPENRLLARGSRFRMDSEMIRDQVLATSGLLNSHLYGKSVKPPQPAGLWKSVGMPSSYPREYVADSGDKIYRRSLYTFWKRGMPPPQMTILNAPTREECIARRERTNTPLQALLLLNEGEYIKAARHLAHTILTETPTDPPEQIATAYETITSFPPDAEELTAMLGTLTDLQALYQEDPSLAEALCEGLDLKTSIAPPQLAALTMVVSSIYNLDISKTRQ